MDLNLQNAAALLRQARHIAVLTGAGISAESGIPTFRDPLTGLWSRFDAAELATEEAYQRDPPLVWGWYEWRRMQVMRAEPNAGHLALAQLARQVPRFTLITQNVDDLHERAGSQDVLHLHGSLHHPRCLTCGQSHALPAGMPDEPEGGRRLAPPPCHRCGGPIRPGVVWFNENLPANVWQAAESAVADCDLLLVIGTSGMVYPAASLADRAKARDKLVITINPVRTALDNLSDILIVAPSGQALPAIMDLIKN